MRKIGNDKTLEREFLKRMKYLVSEYEKIKNKKHERFIFVEEFYKVNKIKKQNFIKYYNRYKQNRNNDQYLLPLKRGPKYKTRRIGCDIEKRVIELRKLGTNRYEIHSLLKSEFKELTPSPTCIYNTAKRFNLNKLNKSMKKEYKKIIKKKAGELGHIDCHYLERGLIKDDEHRYYLVCLIDDCTRIAHAEITKDIKSLSVMFKTLKILNIFNVHYKIQYEEILSDNGPEFGKKNQKDRSNNPFERLLEEMNIKHRYTRPYRPQTNGKVERFWKTLKAELLEDVIFDSLEEFKEELLQYLYYYNNLRPHQGINGKTPIEFYTNLSSK